MQAEASSTPAFVSGSGSGANRRARGGIVKMLGLLIEGVGVIVSGYSLSNLLSDITGNGSNSTQLGKNFVNTLEAGIIIVGIGVIIMGIGIYLDSRRPYAPGSSNPPPAGASLDPGRPPEADRPPTGSGERPPWTVGPLPEGGRAGGYRAAIAFPARYSHLI